MYTCNESDVDSRTHADGFHGAGSRPRVCCQRGGGWGNRASGGDPEPTRVPRNVQRAELSIPDISARVLTEI